MEIAFEESTNQISSADLAFLCAALNVQMRDHFAPAWQEEPWPVRAYPDVSRLPLGTFWPISIQPTIDVPNALGYHSFKAGLSYGKVRWSDSFDTTSVTASHEALELRLDPFVNRWIKVSSNKYVAVEACDPCQADTYPIKVNLLGKVRTVIVSDFVLPAYFVKDAPPPYSYLDTLPKNAFSLGLSKNGGGYLITRDSQNNINHHYQQQNPLTRFFSKPQLPAKLIQDPTNPNYDPLSRLTKRRAGAVGALGLGWGKS